MKWILKMKKLNVLYSFPYRMGVSGIGMTSWSQVKELTKKNTNIYLFVASLEKEIEGLAYLKETFNVLGARLPLKPFGGVYSAKIHDLITSRILESGKHKIDVVHCWPLGSENTLKAARKLGIKTFLERPNTHTEFAFDIVRQEYELIGLKQTSNHTHTFNKKHLEIENREYALTDKILCPSEFVAETFRQKGFEDKKLAFHHYGYDPEMYSAVDDGGADAVSVGGKAGRFSVVFVGRCEPRKGLHYALDAWLASNACKSGEFYIYGDFVEGYRELLQEKLSHASIKIMGHTQDVAGALRNSDALILPSIEEGSALVTYEARACGCTLLISDSTGAKASHMFDSLIHKARDVEKLIEHINLLYEDNGLLGELKANSIAVAQEITWEKSAEKLIEIYTSAVS
jgi:glycosyltransferase involved in cell wall biosynthesis